MTYSPTAERKIFFYRVHVGTDTSGQYVPAPTGANMNEISKLSNIDARRYLPGAENTSTFAIVDRASAPHRMRLATIRMNGLPQSFDAGNLGPIPLLPSAGLAESTHICFFPNNIMGSVSNFYGPRATRLSAFLQHCFPRQAWVYVEPLIRTDVLAKLQRLNRITLFDLKIRRSYADLIREADRSLADAFDAAAAVGDVESVEIILKSEGRKGSLGTRVLRAVKALAGNQEIRTQADRLTIKGDGPSTKVEWLDLLQDRLVVRRTIMLQDPRTRALEDNSAYRAIEAAFAELQEDLFQAAGVYT